VADDFHHWSYAVGWIERPDREDHHVFVEVLNDDGTQRIEFPKGMTPAIIAALMKQASNA
jgi:desulfoferrodoxin (superoxide reductase-like protein)